MYQQYLHVVSQSHTPVCPACQLGRAELPHQFLHMAKCLVLMSAIEYTGKNCDKDICHCCISALDCLITGPTPETCWCKWEGNPTVNASERKVDVEIKSDVSTHALSVTMLH